MNTGRISRYEHEELRTLASGSMLTTYVAVGTAMENALIKYRIVNETDANLTISFDGVTDHDRIPANTAYIDDAALESGGSSRLAKGTTIYVKYDLGAGPTTGDVFVTAIYNKYL